MPTPNVTTDIKFMDSIGKREVQITRLRMWHVLNNTWLKVLGKSTTDLCSKCQLPETTEHMLLACIKNDISILLLKKCEEKKVECTVKNL